MVNDEVKTDTKKNRSYISGWFTGFAVSLFSLLFIIFLGYFCLTPNAINRALGTSITTGNSDFDNLTLSQIVPKVFDAISSGKEVSLKDLQSRYGIAIPVEGGLLVDLNEVKLSELSSFVNKKLENVSLFELSQYDLISLSDTETIDLSYYYKNGKLYSDLDGEIEPRFDYVISPNENQVYINGVRVAELADVVTIDAKYIPITKLLGELSKNVNDFTLKDVTNLGLNLPNALSKLPLDTKLKDVESAILDLTVGELFGGKDFKMLNILDLNMKLKDFDKNISTAIKTKTFSELKDAGLLDLDVDMEKIVPYINQKVGDLTLETLVIYLSMM